MKIYPARALTGTIDLPGDKSISHRAALIAAMAVGDTRIENFSTAEDCQTTIRCLRELGVPISQNGTEVVVTGVGKNGFRKPELPLDCGNSGTTIRLLAGILAGQSFDSVLTGDESLLKRPMARILSPLTQMGADIDAENARAPIHIHGGQTLLGINHELTVASAQVKSCLLFAGLLATGKTILGERPPTRDHTERMLRWFGAKVNVDFDEISVMGDSVLTACDLSIPTDISSAAFSLVAAACLKGSDIMVPNVGLNPTRTGILDVLRDTGANVQVLTTKEVCYEPVGSVRVRGGLGQRATANHVILEGSFIPGIIDELPIIAVLGTQLNKGIEVRDAGELRVKETDRIAAIIENLKRMGAEVTEFDDGFKVKCSHLKGAVVDSLGDHRIAMAFAVAGLLAEGETEIIGAKCANISFPGFFDVLDSVVR